MKPTVSIITVCYNAEKTIENTICSILQQSFTGYEYIIIDGQSEDGTNDIIQNYLSAFADRGITVKYISEKDDGIYYAMNKGIDMAEGEWIAFMNADDSYYDSEVLQDIFGDNRFKDYDVIYGSTNCINDKKEEIYKPQKLDIIKKHMAFPHQSSFVKTDITKKKHFDVTYRLAADYQFFLELWLEHKKFMELEERVVSNFSECGISTQKGYETVAESRKIRYHHNIPGNSKIKDWLDYAWWVGVHLGGRRIKKC